MNLRAYLKDTLRISDAYCEVVLTAYNKFTNYPEPNVAGDENMVLFLWDMKYIHIDVEVYPDGHCEFFFLERGTDETYEEDYMFDGDLSADVIRHLDLLTNI